MQTRFIAGEFYIHASLSRVFGEIGLTAGVTDGTTVRVSPPEGCCCCAAVDAGSVLGRNGGDGKGELCGGGEGKMVYRERIEDDRRHGRG